MSASQRASHQVNEDLCLDYAATRDPATRNEIIQRYQWLVVVCARQMHRRGEQLEDLIQVGNIGLIRALDHYNPEFGVTFRTYASASIMGVLRRHYRTMWRVYVPRRMQEKNYAVSRCIETLTAQLKRSPSVDDIAAYLSISPDEVLRALEAGYCYWPGQALPDEDSSGTGMVGEPDEMDEVDAMADVDSMLATLPARTRSILYMRYFLDMTQAEIGERLNLSQVHVSRLMRSGLAQLRRSHGAEGLMASH